MTNRFVLRVSPRAIGNLREGFAGMTDKTQEQISLRLADVYFMKDGSVVMLPEAHTPTIV